VSVIARGFCFVSACTKWLAYEDRREADIVPTIASLPPIIGSHKLCDLVITYDDW
jgi:hypothetical protein